MATFVMQTDVGPTCPICLGLFQVPRQLPCAHSFCQSCLQSYITSKSTEHEKQRCIECPVCRQTAGNFNQNKSTSEWATFFPVDNVLQSMLPTKSKVERVCDACNSEGISVTATAFCAVCQEAMCYICLSVHKKQKISKSHAILTTEDLQNNVQNVMKFAEGFTCFEHEDEDLKFYCNNHKIACCSLCFLENHKPCSNVRKMKEELPALLNETKTSEIIEELKKLETHLKTVIDIKESNINDMESQVNGLADQIREMRKKINTVFDELEMKVVIEGRRIKKEVAMRTEEENHQYLSLIHAIKNSQLLCEAVHKYGNDIQKYLTAKKIKSQLPLYCSQVREKCDSTKKISLHEKFTTFLKSILSLLSSDVIEIVTITRSNLCIPGLGKPTNLCHAEKVETFEVEISGRTPYLSGVAILPRDRLMLVEHDSGQCILLNNSHQVVKTCKYNGKLFDICVLSDEDVAVTLWNQPTILILSVRDDVIRPVRTIRTKYPCMGITAAGKGEMAVVGDCGNNKCCWSLIRDMSEVSYSDHFATKSVEFYADYGYPKTYIALNNSKTQVYVTEPVTNSLHCFSIEGKMRYTYSHDNLKYPLGVAVDRDDNIYVVGYNSHNIHQLSPLGCNLQVINIGVPRNPIAISFDKSGGNFTISNMSERKKLNIYELK